MREKYPYFLLVLASMFWGGNFVFGRVAGHFFPPFTFSLFRWLIAIFFMTPFLLRRVIQDWGILRNYKGILLLLAATGVAGFNTILYAALHYTTSINAAVINSTTPLVIALLSVFILQERLKKVQAFGILLSIVGILFTLSEGSITKLQSLSVNLGDLLVLAAVACWGLYSVVVKKYANLLPTISTFYLTSLLGAVMLIPFSIYEMHQPSANLVFEPLSIFILIYVGLFASIAAFLSWNTGVHLVGATRAGIFLNLIPVFASIFAPFLSKESLTWYQAVGGLIVISGVLISSQMRGRRFFKKNL
jgi:drug/metabolite transporter (DMT)-like permease